MGVNVPNDSCPRHPAYVDPYVKPLRMKGTLQPLHASSYHIRVLPQLFVGEGLQVGGMPVRSYHEMPRIIWPAIQDNKVALGSEQDVIDLVLVFRWLVTENAAF